MSRCGLVNDFALRKAVVDPGLLHRQTDPMPVLPPEQIQVLEPISELGEVNLRSQAGFSGGLDIRSEVWAYF